MTKDLAKDKLQYLELMSKSINGVIYIRSLEGEFRYLSQNIESILGFSQDEFKDIMQNALSDELEQNDNAKRTWENIRQGQYNELKSIPVYNIELTKNDNSKIVFEAREMIAEENDELLVHGVFLDVTEYQRMLFELQGNSQGLMVIHHTQNRLMGVYNRLDLFKIALESCLSMMEFHRGAVYDLYPKDQHENLIEQTGVEEEKVNDIKHFPLPDLATDGTLGTSGQTTSIILTPGHTWLEPVKSLGEQVMAVMLFCHGIPETLVAIDCAKAYNRDSQRLLQLIGTLIANAIENAYMHLEVEKLQIINPETGLLRRAYISDYLAKEDHLIARYNKTVSVIVYSVENENEVDRSSTVDFSKLLAGNARKTDMLANWSDEVVLVYLNETDEKGAELATKRYQSIFNDWKLENNANTEMKIICGTLEGPSQKVEALIEQTIAKL